MTVEMLDTAAGGRALRGSTEADSGHLNPPLAQPHHSSVPPSGSRLVSWPTLCPHKDKENENK